MGPAGAGAVPHSHGGGRHGGERARVLPVPPVPSAPRVARWDGGRGRVREESRREGARDPGDGRPVAGARVRRAVHPARQRRPVGQAEAGMTPDVVGTWLAALLTLCIFSFLYKDNPFYKFAEHLFVGVSAGYYIILNWW